MKRWRILLIVAVLTLVTVLAFQWQSRRAQAKREVGYQASYRLYAEKFQPGVTRKAVEDYFRTNAIAVQGGSGPRLIDPRSDLIHIGRDPASWYCSTLDVYVAFDFAETVKHDPAINYDSDVLKTIRIDRGLFRCL